MALVLRGGLMWDGVADQPRPAADSCPGWWTRTCTWCGPAAPA